MKTFHLYDKAGSEIASFNDSQKAEMNFFLSHNPHWESITIERPIRGTPPPVYRPTKLAVKNPGLGYRQAQRAYLVISAGVCKDSAFKAALRLPCAKNYLLKPVRLERITAEHLAGRGWSRFLVAKSVRPALASQISKVKQSNSEKAECDYKLSIITF